MTMPLFTILTPTFNRAHTLPALKASIDLQTFKDFEWLIVDDGSTDGTENLVAMWEKTSLYPIRRLYSTNGGKHRALNRGIPEAAGRWIYIVDSDDSIPYDALANIFAFIPEAEADSGVGGIMGLKQNSKGQRIGEDFPPSLIRRDAAALTFMDGLRGDKAEVFKASVLRKFPFPEFPDEKFITECVVWFRIAKAGFDLLLLREPIYTCEYRADGLSAKSFMLRLANPCGTLLFYAEELSLSYPLRSLFREAVNYVRFSLLCFTRCKMSPPKLPLRTKLLVSAAVPFGLMVAVIDIVRLAANRKKNR